MAKKLVLKKTPAKRCKLRNYTWQIYSSYGYLKAKNMTNAICNAIKKHIGSNSKQTRVRIDILVKKGKHNVC
jgi:hypothetical protein